MKPYFQNMDTMGKALSDKAKKRKKPKRPRATRVVGQPPRVVAAMGWRALRALHPEVRVAGTVGLGDPADTATLLTLLAQIDLLTYDGFDLDLRGDFLGETTQLFGHARVWIVPAELGVVLLIWAIQRDTRQVLRTQITRD